MHLILQNCKIIDPVTSSVTPGDIVIKDGKILSLRDPGAAKDIAGSEIIDCSGKYASPGFADAHFHSESTMLSLGSLAEVLIRRGTTALYINPHEVANVAGIDGVRTLLRDSASIPLHIFLIAPCKVPTAPKLEKSGAAFGPPELEEMLSWPDTVGIGEIDAHKLLHPSEPYTGFIEKAKQHKLAVCGSINGFRGRELQTCFASGITDDHESVSGAEALEKLRYGAYLHVREGSTEQNLTDILAVLRDHPGCFSRICFCCDDKMPGDLLHVGHIDNNIRKAVEAGIDPVAAIGMATCNTAAYYGQEDRFGHLSPGREADIVLMDEIDPLHVTDVFFAGRQVLRNGELIWHAPKSSSLPDSVYRSIHINRRLSVGEMLIPCASGERAHARIVQITPGQIVNRILTEELPVKDGMVRADNGRNIQHFALVERYQGEGKVLPAFVKGYGITRGAFAASVSHDHHHLVCVGVDPVDMAAALNRIIELGGGMTVAAGGVIQAELPLPIWGLLSSLSAEETARRELELNRAVETLGCSFAQKVSPFAVLSLMSLPVIGEAGFTDQGLIDVRAQKIMPVLCE
ncbi:MAG: adenine deaminase [Lachnospiraceae bacterium]|nr:adenine deaminase [Lachnospiraceae bacterium]